MRPKRGLDVFVYLGMSWTIESSAQTCFAKVRILPIIIIDQSRLPSQGRDVAMVLRSYKTIRTIPLVFVEGDPGKLESVKAQIPDAFYTS